MSVEDRVPSRWNHPGRVEEIVWNMRLADLPRAENRAILNRTYNGEPPFDEDTAEENAVQVNRNDLEGTNLLAQARRQWNNAFLKSGNYFTVTVTGGGPPHKRREWGHAITKHLNHELKTDRAMLEQERGTGGNAILHGPGHTVWENRTAPVPKVIDVGSVLIPSETIIDWENLEYVAFFREWTPAMLYELTHGPKVDPGWNMGAVREELRYVAEQVQKQPNATAFQYMPERVEEMFKQDLGYWGSDAVPTVDAWDFYFRQGDAIYRRIIPDWGVSAESLRVSKSKPKSRLESYPKEDDERPGFLYTSRDRKYANGWGEIFHTNFADCSAVFPQRYHSVRSLGWMLWGIVDLENRLDCKFTEAVFENLLWFFRVAGNSDMIRLKRAMFQHMGVIPQGVTMVGANDRYTPNAPLVELLFSRFQRKMQNSAASFTQDFDKGADGKEMTATETMARVNSVNALVSGMLGLAYTYEEFKYLEICRRYCLKHSKYLRVLRFRKNCLRDGVPVEVLDVDRWEVAAERVLGGGNKTLEMAQANFLQQLRKNLGPEAQRVVDHIAIEASTDDAKLAEVLAPVDGQKRISNSQNNAQLATDRLMRGLPFHEPPDMVAEDYVKVWLADMATIVQQIENAGGVGTPEQVMGLQNLEKNINQLLERMSQNEDDAERAKQYGHGLQVLMNHVKAFVQRQQQAAKKQMTQNGEGQGAMEMAKVNAAMMMVKVKTENARISHGQKTAQRQIAFEMDEQRKDRESNAEIRRKAAEHGQDLAQKGDQHMLELAMGANRMRSQEGE